MIASLVYIALISALTTLSPPASAVRDQQRSSLLKGDHASAQPYRFNHNRRHPYFRHQGQFKMEHHDDHYYPGYYGSGYSIYFGTGLYGQGGYWQWVKNGKIPRGTYIIGYDYGSPIYYCQASHHNHMFYGRLLNGRCHIDYYGQILRKSHYKVWVTNY